MDDTWAENFSSMIKNSVVSGLWLIIFVIVHVLVNNGTVDESNRTIYSIIPGLGCGYYGLKAAWFAIIAIAWPILVILGVVSVSVVSTAVQKVDEGGLKSIADRVWYGKDGPSKN